MANIQNSDKLTSDLINVPQMWRLSMELKPKSLEVVLYSTLEDHSLVHRSIPLDTALDPLKAFEEVIYDNPLLLADFGKTDLLVDTNRFMTVPESVASDEAVSAMVQNLWPGDDTDFVDNQLPVPGCRFITEIDTPMLAFIRRTFPTVKLLHPLAALATYFYNKDRFSNSTRIYVNLRETSIDIIYFVDGKLKVVNTFSTPTIEDMIYYILAIAKEAEFDLKEDEIMLCGIPAIREKIAPELRKYASYVMPVVFPSAMYHSGKDSLEAPFELILLPLCV